MIFNRLDGRLPLFGGGGLIGSGSLRVAGAELVSRGGEEKMDEEGEHLFVQIGTPTPPSSPIVGDGKEREEDELKGESRKKKPTMACPCDDMCELRKDWHTKLHSACRHFVSAKDNVAKLRTELWQFECCNYCLSGQYPQCDAGDDCLDMLKLMREIQPHRVGVRTLVRVLYQLREYNCWMAEVDRALQRGDFEKLCKLMEAESKKGEQTTDKTGTRLPLNMREQIRSAEQRDEGTDHCEHFVQEQWGAIMELYENKIRDFPECVCDICGMEKYGKEVRGVR